jgi:PAS domain S-box-containing protein
MKLASSRVLAIALVFVLVLWVVDAAVGAGFFYHRPFLDLLLRPEPAEIYVRVVSSAALLLFGVTAFAFMRHARTAGDLERDIQARYSSILTNTSDGALAADPSGRITAFSPGAERIFGYPAHEMIGRPIASLCPEDLRAEQAETWAVVMETGAVSGFETERLARDGRRVPVELTVNLVRDGDGRPLGTTAVIRDITERRRAAEALRDRERRLTRIFRVAPIGFGIARNRILLEVSDQVCEMLGRGREELVGQDARIFYPSDEEYRRVAAERDLQAPTREIVSVDTLWRHRDGRILNVILNSSPIDRDDPAKGVIFAAQDVTGQIRSRLDLEEQHLHLQQAQELAHVGSWTFDLGEGWVAASREAKRIYGLSGDAWSIPDVQTVPLPEFREGLDKALADLVQHGKPYDVTFSIMRRTDGQIRVVHSMARFDHQRNRVTGVIQDITEQRLAEEALRASEERFRGVVEQSLLAIYLLVDDRFELVNPRFCEITGVTPEEARAPGFDFRELIAPESLHLVEDRRRRRMRGEPVSDSYEFTIRNRSGHKVHVVASVAAIRYQGKDAVLGFLHDVSTQRGLEEQLDQVLRIESISRLSGGVAHDLNNLLSPILGHAELLLEDLDPGDAHRESADAILQAAFRARDLVKQLLAFSRQQPMEMGTVDVNAMVREFDGLLRRTLREDVRIEMDLDRRVSPVTADRRQLEQVLMNLAVNAQDAMPDGGTLRIVTRGAVLDDAFVSTHPGSGAGRYVALDVRDSGEGMDAETLKRIFEPFFTTKGMGKGTGLGLATVYGIVKQHDGYIDVHSEPGRGATFTCYFPVAQGTAPAPAPKMDVIVQLGGSETVLVVEDEDLVRGLVVSVLSRQGYAVLQAPDGEAALGLLADYRGGVDLLLTDVVLPGINGRELYREIHSMSPRTKVIFMSGHTGEVITERGVPTDDTFIQKPFSTQALAARVRKTLDSA